MFDCAELCHQKNSIERFCMLSLICQKLNKHKIQIYQLYIFNSNLNFFFAVVVFRSFSTKIELWKSNQFHNRLSLTSLLFNIRYQKKSFARFYFLFSMKGEAVPGPVCIWVFAKCRWLDNRKASVLLHAVIRKQQEAEVAGRYQCIWLKMALEYSPLISDRRLGQGSYSVAR